VLLVPVISVPVISVPVISVPESLAMVDLPKVLRKVQQEPPAQAVAVSLSGAKRR
jgi:hypothetical protein